MSDDDRPSLLLPEGAQPTQPQPPPPPPPPPPLYAHAHTHTHAHAHAVAPAIPRRRPTLPVLGCLLVLCFVGIVTLEAPFVIHEFQSYQAEHSPRTHARERRRAMRAQYPDLGGAPPAVEFGLWDQSAQITPLEIAVVVSLSMSIDEDSIEIFDNGMHFFKVVVVGEGRWLVELIRRDEFLASLNVQASLFGASLVLSQAPVERWANASSANAK